MRYMIYPYTQNSRGAIALAAELGGQRILRENSHFDPQPDDMIINWGASDCPYPGALNKDNSAVLNKLTFFQRLQGTLLTPGFATDAQQAAATLSYPIFCRTRLKGRDGAGIVVADTAAQLVTCPLYVSGVPKTSEYRIHIGRLPDGTVTFLGAQKKVHGQPHEGQDPRVWTGESTRFVWTVGGQPALIPPAVYNVVNQAFDHFPELTFGAFDVVYSTTHGAFVLEINSAPLMTPETAKRYGDFFRDIQAMLVTPSPAPAIAPAPLSENEVYLQTINHPNFIAASYMIGDACETLAAMGMSAEAARGWIKAWSSGAGAGSE